MTASIDSCLFPGGGCEAFLVIIIDWQVLCKIVTEKFLTELNKDKLILISVAKYRQSI